MHPFFICDKSKITKILPCLFYGIFFVINLTTTLRCSLNFEELFISLFMTFNQLIFKQLLMQTCNSLVKSLFIISTFFDALIIVDVHPALIPDRVALIGAFLNVIPLCGNRIPISCDAVIIVIKHTNIIIYIIKIFLDEFK